MLACRVWCCVCRVWWAPRDRVWLWCGRLMRGHEQQRTLHANGGHECLFCLGEAAAVAAAAVPPRCLLCLHCTVCTVAPVPLHPAAGSPPLAHRVDSGHTPHGDH